MLFNLNKQIQIVGKIGYVNDCEPETFFFEKISKLDTSARQNFLNSKKIYVETVIHKSMEEKSDEYNRSGRKLYPKT